MIKFSYIVLFLTISLHASNIFPVVLQNIINDNPSQDTNKEKILLANVYLNQSKNKASRALVLDVLKKNPKNINALNLKKVLDIREKNVKVFNKLHLSYPIKINKAEQYLKTQYEKDNYKQYINVYHMFGFENIHLDDIFHIHAAYIYMWDGNYSSSKEALDKIKQKNNLDKKKIEADICYYTGDYACAISMYKKLYDLNHDVSIGVKLIYSYYYMGQFNQAKKLYAELFKKYPQNKELSKANQQFKKLSKKHEVVAKKKYEKLRDLASLKEYCTVLYDMGKKDATLDVLKNHNMKYATDASYLLEASYLNWMNKYNDAMNILRPLISKNNLSAKLLAGKILSWQGDFVPAENYLLDCINTASDKKLVYDAKKALAFIYKWQNKNEKAKKLFLELLKENKQDNEVIEAIMELNGDYSRLINLYKNKPSSGENMKRLSELYFHNNEKDKSLEILKKYVKDNPEDLDATKNLAMMLIDKKDFYSGFGQLEYYAAQKNDQNSSILLAEQYYWNGFSKEAVDVLDHLLTKYPNNVKARNLRAEILKVSPRFTKSNSGNTVDDYFKSVDLKQLEIADALYFNGHHGSSLMYYENYLSQEPDNHNVRLRYAFALENAGKYAKAEGEFALMLWSDESDEVKYHYGYNLMMNHKLAEAEKVFRALKNSVFEPIPPKLHRFIQSWKKTRESKKFADYAKFYSKKMINDELWSLSQQQLFTDVTFISVGLYDIVSRQGKTPNRYIVKFYEEMSTNKDTKKGYRTLEIQCGASELECQIDNEAFVKGEYEKFVPLTPIINQRLRDIQNFKKSPKLLKSVIVKKKNILNMVSKNRNSLLPHTNTHYISEADVLKKVGVKVISIESYLKHPTLGAYPKHVPKNILQKGYYFSDSDDVIFASYDILGRKVTLGRKLSLGLDIGKFFIHEKNNIKSNGIRYGLSLYYEHFVFRLRQNKYDNFSEFVPTIQYIGRHKDHNYQVEYTRQNALFYVYRKSVLDKHIVANHFSLTDYISFKNNRSLWANIAVNAYSNKDIEMIAQFDWRFFYHQIKYSEFSYDIALEGWYDAHSKKSDLYYSPKFTDSTLIRIDTKYPYSKYIGLKALAGTGYSFYDKYMPYKYGMSLFGNPTKHLSYDAGCLVGSSIRKSSDSQYRYLECNFSLGYAW